MYKGDAQLNYLVVRIPTFAFSMTFANSPAHRKQWWGESRRKQSPLLSDEARGSTSLVCTCLLPEHKAKKHQLPERRTPPATGRTRKHPVRASLSILESGLHILVPVTGNGGGGFRMAAS